LHSLQPAGFDRRFQGDRIMSTDVRTLIDQLMVEMRDSLRPKIESLCEYTWGKNWKENKLPGYIADNLGRMPSEDSLHDPMQIFKLIKNAWTDVFGKPKGPWGEHVRKHISKFYSLRNDWAHHTPISQRELKDALGKACVVMREIGDWNYLKKFEKAMNQLDQLEQQRGQRPLFPDSEPAEADSLNKIQQGETEPLFSANISKGKVWSMLDVRQRTLIRQRNKSGYRRIRGSAGSGKTIVLAARAVEAASQGEKRVLVMSYNRTLVNYLKSLVREYAQITDQLDVVGLVDCRHFHGWCLELHDIYKVSRPKLKRFNEQNDWNEYNKNLIEGAFNIIKEHIEKDFQPYDAILVDEGQDFYLEWWQLLRMVVVQDEDEKGWTKGEMMLVADATQDLYGTASAWTDEAMLGAGFRGPWFELEASYRMPPQLVPLLTRFMDDHLPKTLPVNRPVKSKAKPEDFPFKWHWHNVTTDPIHIVANEVERIAGGQREIVVQVPSRQGLKVVAELSRRGLDVRHIFDRQGINTKDGFRLSPGEVGVITAHSFKGYEAPLNVVWIDNFGRVDKRYATYVAISRVKRHPDGSELIVINQTPELACVSEDWRIMESTQNSTNNNFF